MNKEKNIIRFYALANKLKNKLRSGWLEIKIGKERTESVAEHVYGTLILAIAINGEYRLNLDMSKILYMLSLHELEEIIIPDYTVRSNITADEKIKLGKEAVKEVTTGLFEQKLIEKLLDEFNEQKTKEACFCYYIDKLECDFQCKLYDLDGAMKIENVIKDIKLHCSNAEEIINQENTASDIWIETDRFRYCNDEIFLKLLNKMKEVKDEQDIQ